MAFASDVALGALSEPLLRLSQTPRSMASFAQYTPTPWHKLRILRVYSAMVALAPKGRIICEFPKMHQVRFRPLIRLGAMPCAVFVRSNVHATAFSVVLPLSMPQKEAA